MKVLYRGEPYGTEYFTTRANLQFGPGGLAQYYVPNVKELIEKGVLVPVEKVMLIK